MTIATLTNVCIIHVWHPDNEMNANMGKRIMYAIKRTKRDKLNVYLSMMKIGNKGPLTTQESSLARIRVPGALFSSRPQMMRYVAVSPKTRSTVI